MKIKHLLALALISLGTALTAQAQVVKEDFSAPQTKTATEQGYYEFINLQPAEGEKVDKWAVADGVLNIENSADYLCSGQKWQRAIKFRNLPLQEKTFYKLSLDLTTNETYIDPETSTEASGYLDMKIMQGDENADICILGANLSEQRINYTLNAGDSKKYSKVFYYASKTKQDSAYEANCAGKELYDPAKYFVGINVYSPGKYVLDNVLLEEATAIDSIGFYGQAIKVYYGDQLNAAALCAGKKQYVLDNSSATVTINGEPADIISVEIKADGYLYVFVDSELSTTDDVKVSFKAPAEVQFTGAYAGASLDFADVQAVEDETIEATSWLMDEPELVSSVPVNGSFALDQTISEFMFTFDKPVYTVKTDAGEAPVATLSNGETLTLMTTEETSKTLIFQRTSNEKLAKGTYTLNLSNIFNVYGTELQGGVQLTFEVGKVQLAETVYTPVSTSTFPEADVNNVPVGWTVISDGQIRLNQEGGYSGGGRVFATTAPQQRGIYTRAASGDASITSPIVTIPQGNIEIRNYLAYWSNPSTIQVDVFKATESDTTIVATKNFNPAVAGEANRNNTGFQFETDNIQFVNDAEANFFVKYTCLTTGYNGIFVGGFDTYTYVETQGDKPDSETIFAEAFATTDDNIVPAEETGWNLYDAGALLNYGSNGSGASSRIFATSFTNLPKAYYCRQMGGDGYYGIYGEQEAKPFTLKSGNLDFTFYTAGWKTNGVNMTWSLLDANNEVVKSDVVTINCNMGGSKTQTGDAQKSNYTLNIPEDGNYKLKFAFDGEAMVGNISLVKVGSKAAQYASLLAASVKLAKEELEKEADPMYDGTTKTALQLLVDTYSKENDMTTAEEYNEVIALIDDTRKALATRASNIATYNTAKGDIAAYIGTVEEKYQSLDFYKTLADTYAQYENVEAQSLEDDELASAASTLTNSYNLTKNNVEKCIPFLTRQINNLYSQITDMDVALPANIVNKVNNAVSDDQDLAYTLKLYLAKAMYDKCATEDNPFVVFDEGSQTEVDAPFDITYFVQNSDVYTTAIAHDNCKISNYPGWQSDNANYAMRPNYGWGGWTGSATYPVSGDMFIGIGWTDGGVTVWNNATGLPVGKYEMTIQTMDRSGVSSSDPYVVTDSTKQQSYIFYVNAEDSVAKAFDVTDIGMYYNFTDDVMSDVNFNGEVLADVKIGAYIHATQSFAAIQKVQLKMVGKKEGFDYAAAAAAVKKLIGEEVIAGDANNDAKVDVADITAVASFILGTTPDSWNAANADANEDGKIDVADITKIASIILSAKKQLEE